MAKRKRPPRHPRVTKHGYRDGGQRNVRVPRWRRQRPNVTPPPPGPRKRTWIRGTLAIRGPIVFVGGWPLFETFAGFNGKNVRGTLEVLP